VEQLGLLRALTDVLPGPDGPLPLLILDCQPELTERGGPADLFVSTVLTMGLTPVTTATISEPPAPAPGWLLEVSALRAARLTAPDGPVMWDGECGQPQPWRALITSTSQCAVLIGAIGLWPARAAIRIETRLGEAADAGELAGGLVPARCVS
jgi:hypothetical protein